MIFCGTSAHSNIFAERNHGHYATSECINCGHEIMRWDNGRGWEHVDTAAAYCDRASIPAVLVAGGAA